MSVFLCLAALAVDGDTLRCSNVPAAGGFVRLARIDAPELPGHCRPPSRGKPGRVCAPGDPFAAKAALASLVAGGPVRCRQVDASPGWRGFQALDRYGRVVARCSVHGRDLGKAQLAGGFAVKWPVRPR